GEQAARNAPRGDRRRRFPGVHDAGVQSTSPVVERALIRHFVRQGVLEGVLELRTQLRSVEEMGLLQASQRPAQIVVRLRCHGVDEDRKSTRLNSSHEWISYAVFCLKKKNEVRSR